MQVPKETHREIADITKELRDHPDVIAVKVWTVWDVLDSADYWTSDHDIVLDKDEWDKLERRVRSEGAGRMELALSDCTDREWDVVDDFVHVEIDNIVKSRKLKP